MNKETLDALKGSIAKWESIVAGKDGSLGAENCPLCHLFLKYDTDRDIDECNGCPVFEKTRKHACINSPYEQWIEANTSYRHGVGHMAVEPDAIAAAQAELDFLKSLLPENAQP